MVFNSFSQTKCKTQCQLCSGRIRLMRNKRNIQLKKSRGEVANLLKIGKVENARIRVEAVMREEAMLQAYEIIELFVELLQVRSAILERAEDVPSDMMEAISSLIYASSRVTDLPELATIAKMLAAKFGKEYAAEAGSDHMCRKWQVIDNIIRWLSIEAPSPEDKIACLQQIAQEHGVDWSPEAAGGAPTRPSYLAGSQTPASDPNAPAGGGPPGGAGGRGGGGSGVYNTPGPFGGAEPPAHHPPPRSSSAKGAGGNSLAAAAGSSGIWDEAARLDDLHSSELDGPTPQYGRGPEFGGFNQTGANQGAESDQRGSKEAATADRLGSGGSDDGIVNYPTAGAPTDGVVNYPSAGSRQNGEGVNAGGADDYYKVDEAALYERERKQEQDKAAAASPFRPQVQLPDPEVQEAPSPSPSPPAGHWAPPPGSSRSPAQFQSRIDAVGKWKAQKEGRSPSPATPPGGYWQPPSHSQDGGASAGAAGSNRQQDAIYKRQQAAYDAAPGSPSRADKAAAQRPGLPSAPAAPAAPPKAAEKEVDEFEELQKRFDALKRR